MAFWTTTAPPSLVAAPTSFTISTGFAAGVNSLDLVVTNGGGPTGAQLAGLSLGVSGNVTYTGTAGDDAIVVNATGANSGTLTVTTAGTPMVPSSARTS